LDGATLDLQPAGDALAGNIGSAGNPIDTLTLASGMLKNVAQINGGGAVSKTGTNTLTLAGNNTFTGSLTVNSRTLNLTGASTGGGSLTIAPGALLRGGGSHTGPVVLNGTVSPGSSPGTLSTGPLTLNGGGSYVCEVIDATNAPGSGFDSMNITGGID